MIGSQDQSRSRPSSARRTTVRLWPTMEGWMWLAVAGLLLYQGWLRTINLVALVASVLLALWLLNFFVVRSYRKLRQVRIARQVREEVFAGRPFAFELEISNPTRTCFRNVSVVCQNPHAAARGFVPSLKPHGTVTAYGEGCFPSRGRHAWGAVELASGYPFGLFRRTVVVEDNSSLLVLPRLGRVDLTRFRRLLLGGVEYESRNQPRIRQPGSQTEFHGLREFRSGDSPRWIHWRTTARVGELMIREFEEPPVRQLILVLDPWLPDSPTTLRQELEKVVEANRSTLRRLLASGPLPPAEKRKAKEASLARKELPFRIPLENLETAVSVAATLCWEWNRMAGARVTLVVLGEGEPPLSSDGTAHGVLHLLERLAVVQGGPDGVGRSGDAAAGLGNLDTLPAGPVVVLTTRPDGLHWESLTSSGRQVAAIRIAHGEHAEFFDFGTDGPVSLNGSADTSRTRNIPDLLGVPKAGEDGI